MLTEFNDVEIRKSGVIYNSVFEQIKKMYSVDPEQAGQLAIAAIELVLTGQVSNDDLMIDMLLQPLFKVRDNDQQKYELKMEASRRKKIEDLKLQEIADLYNRGLTQAAIGKELGIKQQTISYRLTVIKSNYPELLQEKSNSLPKNEVGTNFVQNGTKKEKLVQIGTKDTKFVPVGTIGDFVEVGKEEKNNSGGSSTDISFIF